MTQKEYDRQRYLRHREERCKARMAYYWEYEKKGLGKPRKPGNPRDPNRRKQRDHERYIENREEILSKQKEYYKTHREQFAERRRRRSALEKIKRGYERKKRKYTRPADAGRGAVGDAQTISA
jgi:hypothetical protein